MSAALPLPRAAEHLKNLRGLQDIPVVRQVGVFALAVAAVALGLMVFFWSQKPSYAPVFAGDDAKSQSEAADLLRKANIPLRADPTGTLSVPEDQVAQARMALATAGLPARTDSGFETLSGDQGFGTSQFLENARYQHALETELSRTIMALSPVREARVHLAIPKPSAFTRDRQPSSASVVLQLRSGGSLEPSQVAAIENLVASSVPDMTPERVTVVDQSGRMLSRQNDDSDDARAAQQADKRRKVEAEYVSRIRELLEPITGSGRVNAKVNVDMDFDQLEEAREVFGDPPKVRSEQLSEVGSGNTGAGQQGVPGSATNTPDPVPTAPAAGAASAAADGGSRSSVRNYELDRTLTHKRQSPGRITRVTAAVLVDDIPGTPGKDGKAAMRKLTPAELTNIQQLVQQSIGFEQARGDTISVINQRFIPDATPEAVDPPLWEHPNAGRFLRIVMGGLIVLAIIWVLLRPTFNQLLGRDKALAAPEEDVVVAQAIDDGAALNANGAAALQKPQPDLSANLLPNPDAQPAPMPAPTLEQEIEYARQQASADPRNVAFVLKSWIGQPGNA